MKNWNNQYEKIKNRLSALAAKVFLLITTFIKKFTAAFKEKFFQYFVGLAVTLVGALILYFGGVDRLIDHWKNQKDEKINYVDCQIRGKLYDSRTDKPLSDVFIGIVGELGDTTHTGASGEFILEFRAHKDSIELKLTFELDGYKTKTINHGIPQNEYTKNFIQDFTLQSEVINHIGQFY